MDPVATNSPIKDGTWEFPEDIAFPIDARVLVKCFKVADTGSEVGAPTSKFLNTKVAKFEVRLSKEDLYTKSMLLAAIERDCGVKNLANQEGIQNPKLEVSIKRQDCGEIFTVYKMGFVVKRLDKLKDKSDTILVEIKEQIISFQSKQPTIKILVNNVARESEVKGRKLEDRIVKQLNSALAEYEGSRYDIESKKIICGKCSVGFKVRDKGAVKSLVKYFQSNHFKGCNEKDNKRKAKEDIENNQKTKKKKEIEKMDQYWEAALRRKAHQDEVDDTFDDPDLNEENEDADVQCLSNTG